jgi:glutathione peroxidase
VKWNFTKFLLNTDGNVVKRFAPFTKPAVLTAEIAALLSANGS